MNSVSSHLGHARASLARRLTPAVVWAALEAMALAVSVRPVLRRELRGVHPSGTPWEWRSRLKFVTRDGSIVAHAVIGGGRMRAGLGAVRDPDLTLRFRDRAAMRHFFLPGTDPLNLLLDNDIDFVGNMTHLSRFAYLSSSLVLGGKPRTEGPGGSAWALEGALKPRRVGLPCPKPPVGETRFLQDPSLCGYRLEDFPRIRAQLVRHYQTQPEICSERARLLTAFMVSRDPGDDARPVWRQARALHHLLTNKRAIVRDDDLLVGTTTSRPVGVVLYPETFATTFWPELLTVQTRELNPYRISDEDIDILAREVFPFWMDGSIREVARAMGDNPEALRLDERMVLTFLWKSYALSHTIADLPAVLGRGLEAIAVENEARTTQVEDIEHRQVCRAMALCCRGVMDYAGRLSARAAELARAPGTDEHRRGELLEIARICAKVPRDPATSLHEAIQAVWIVFLCLHQENVNAGLSIGRLDVWLEPFFARDLEGAADDEERERLVARALELVCALMVKLGDHLPLVPDVGNRLFGGSSSNQAITLGGLTGEGDSAVCDMTWVFLKATELLALRDPNMNARFAPGVNSDAYLWRLCEVNRITGATPSLHNDDAMLPVLEGEGFSLEEARDWAATGCVEPTVCGRHFGHTGCIMFNMVAPLDMALRDGVHPLIGERVGPATGPARGFDGFEDFLEAYRRQLGWLLDMAIQGNNLLGRGHRREKPTPLLSALFQGPLDSGRDVVDGGALHNSTGTAMVGLPDVVDSLAAIKVLVYDRGSLTLADLVEALDRDFEGDEALLAELLRKAPKLGQDHPLPGEFARDLQAFVMERYRAADHYRGGRYFPGYWSMSNHVAFGMLTGALPSGRRRGAAFAPGLTPSPLCGAPLTDQIRAVASLNVAHMPNSLAFNVKVAAGGKDEHRAVVDRMAAYARAYFELGGMQMQFNAVDTQTLRDAVEHPELHRDLLVRISGYNAYFVELNPNMQRELIERMEHDLMGSSG